jgi:putative exosortase-associated protein (TIGR04073 family)
MRKLSCLLSTGALAALVTAGCAGPEQKLGRGMNNLHELVRWGDARRTVEQTALFDGPEIGYTTGAIRGFNRSLARAGIGLYEVITSPIPPYDPVFTDYLSAQPVYPDNYTPRLLEDSMFATDTALGFSGGDVAPMFPGSRFRIFNNP